jgi:hypothetical protein
MSIININTADLPADTSQFKPLRESSDYPYCLLGFQIKNSYDQLRLKFPKKYNAKDIVHLVYYPETEPTFFRGIQLTPTQKINNLLSELKTRELQSYGDLKLKTYRDLLSSFNATCDNCFLYLRPGVYPIDSSNISSFVEESVNLHDLYKDIFFQDDVPFYQSVGYIVLYILDKNNIANKTPEVEWKKISVKV